MSCTLDHFLKIICFPPPDLAFIHILFQALWKSQGETVLIKHKIFWLTPSKNIYWYVLGVNKKIFTSRPREGKQTIFKSGWKNFFIKYYFSHFNGISIKWTDKIVLVNPFFWETHDKKNNEIYLPVHMRNIPIQKSVSISNTSKTVCLLFDWLNQKQL